MSYSYGPTVVYAPAILPMDAFGGPCFEAQENIGRLASCAPPKVSYARQDARQAVGGPAHAFTRPFASPQASSAGSRSALGNLSNLSNVGCYAVSGAARGAPAALKRATAALTRLLDRRTGRQTAAARWRTAAAAAGASRCGARPLRQGARSSPPQSRSHAPAAACRPPPPPAGRRWRTSRQQRSPGAQPVRGAPAPRQKRVTISKFSRSHARAGGPGRQARRNNWVDIDAQNKDNPLACAEYAEAIFQHLSTAEVRAQSPARPGRRQQQQAAHRSSACDGGTRVPPADGANAAQRAPGSAPAGAATHAARQAARMHACRHPHSAALAPLHTLMLLTLSRPPSCCCCCPHIHPPPSAPLHTRSCSTGRTLSTWSRCSAT